MSNHQLVDGDDCNDDEYHAPLHLKKKENEQNHKVKWQQPPGTALEDGVLLLRHS